MITLPEEEGYQIRAQYELLPKDASVMPESTSKIIGIQSLGLLKNLWEEMIKFLKKDSRNCKKASVHYGGCILPIVYRNHIISRCQAQNERCRRA